MIEISFKINDVRFQNPQNAVTSKIIHPNFEIEISSIFLYHPQYFGDWI